MIGLVNKPIAEELKRHGYDERTIAFYAPLIDTPIIDPCHVVTNKEQGITCPTEYQVVNWIFKLVDCKLPDKLIDKTNEMNEKIKWLQLWYATLLRYEFKLMHEFIGRLREWIENNGYYITFNRIYEFNVNPPIFMGWCC